MRTSYLFLLLFLFTFSISEVKSQNLPSPKSYFGFEMGADRKLAHWNKLVEYYNLLGEQSPRMKVVNMGKTTLGNPFIALYISSPENLANLEKIRDLNNTLGDPRNSSQQDIQNAIATGKAVVVQSFGLHSSEVAASQTAAELTYDMLTRDDEEIMRILDNTIAIMIPCFNPDGEIMITEWYNKYVGTEYEAASLPYLYHHYIGHDNNRDAYMQNTIESYYGAQIMFRDWSPQAYVDHHQMGSYTARMYVPPYAEPIRPDGDPLVWREMSWYGAHIAYKEEENGKSGIVNAAIYSGWGHFGFHWITPFHNIAGMLTESASARLATPLYVHPDQLQGSRQLPEYEAQTSFPNPWKGGWWRVRDIVEQQKIAAIATLDIAARNRETVLTNSYLKATRQTERGMEGETKEFIIPSSQHDALTMNKMVNVLLGQGIEVKKSSEAFTHEGKVYDAGTYVVSLAQPKRGVVRWLLGQTYYPDNTYTRDRENNPIRPYDMSTDNIAEYMGVQVDPVGTKVTSQFLTVTERISPEGTAEKGSGGYRIDGKLNDAFKAVNLLWNNKVKVRRVDKASAGLMPGDFIVSNASDDVVEEIAQKTGVNFLPFNGDAKSVSRELDRLRIGMYQRYRGGNMDEGWTRLVLESFDFPYTSIKDAELFNGDLNKKYDVIILPDDGVSAMTGEGGSGFSSRETGSTPPEFRSGFGQKGTDILEAFVKNGGTIVTLGRAGTFALDKFNLPVRNVVEGLPGKEFWSPGSTLKMNIDNTHPIAYGMPEKGLALFLLGNQAYSAIPSANNHKIERVASFIDRDIMQSGWLLGEKHIANRAPVVTVDHGKGEVILIGFRAQHRMQTHGTFKLLFNSLVSR